MKIHYCLLASLILTTNTHAAEQVIWGNIQGNAAHTGYLAEQTNPANYHVLWTTKLADTDRFFDEAIVTDKTAYYVLNSDSYQLFALNIATGEIKWNVTLDAAFPIHQPIMMNNALCVLYQSRSNKATLTAFNPENGDILETHSALDVGTGKFVTDDRAIYLSTMSNLTSLNAHTAQINWRYDETSLQYQGTPALDAQYLYQRTLHGFSIIDKSTGTPLNAGYTNDDIVWNMPDFPVLDARNRAVYLLTRNSPGSISLEAIDTTTLKSKWKKPKVFSNIVVAEDDIYTITPDTKTNHFQLTAINAKTGQTSWQWEPSAGETIESRTMPVATSDTIFVSGTNETFAISRLTHQLVWKINVGGTMTLGNCILLISSPDTSKHSAVITAISLT